MSAAEHAHTAENDAPCGNDCDGPSGHAEGCPVHCHCYDVGPVDCGSNAADWCLAPNDVECMRHDENGDRRRPRHLPGCILAPDHGAGCVREQYASEAWRDKHGDVWRLGGDGLMHTPETRPFPREYVEKKWGPLTRTETGDSDA